MTKEKASFEAIQSAWDFWLADHPVSLPEIIADAVQKSVDKWLDEHGEEIIERLAPVNPTP